MTYTQTDIDTLNAKLGSMTDGERAALVAALAASDEVEGFAGGDLTQIRNLVGWDKVLSGPISGGDLGSGRIKGPISSGDLGSGRFTAPGDRAG